MGGLSPSIFSIEEPGKKKKKKKKKIQGLRRHFWYGPLKVIKISTFFCPMHACSALYSDATTSATVRASPWKQDDSNNRVQSYRGVKNQLDSFEHVGYLLIERPHPRGQKIHVRTTLPASRAETPLPSHSPCLFWRGRVLVVTIRATLCGSSNIS